MKRFVCLLALTMLLSVVGLTRVSAQSSINLTPRAKSCIEKTGKLLLKSGFVVSYGALPDSISAEAARFVSDINATTGLGASANSTTDGLIQLVADTTCSKEGYKLNIAAESVTIKARTTAGFYYAFQTIKKILPANVMAQKYDAGQTYELPCVTISDEPRFGYRGFMLDVSRHFFTVEEVKRMIDLMATYKMNVFHWHLTDDQGWRAEIKKYPKLTTVGATRENDRETYLHEGTCWTNKQYGPYFYTQDEMKEIVQYCADRHIQILPEVDMPGHFVAAMASYPEYSCTPSSAPSVWCDGGISSNVLNVANDKAVKFAKNILDELCDIFPYPYFHIGGDECPTSQWQSNADCQALYKELGLTDYRQLQSRFINEISKYLASKGKRTVMWNESITASGADLDQVKEYNPVIMCWNPCQSGASKAAELGLQNIVTEYHSSTNGLGGGYYINRKQSSDSSEPDGAGYGDDTVEGCYAYVPVSSSVSADKLPFYTGVQGTFWTEWVGNREYLEYLALPRLMAVAEAGWTPQAKKDFTDFTARMAQDTAMLNMNGYEYGRHIFKNTAEDMVRPELSKWYRIQTTATDVRKGTCIELLSASSALLTTYGSKGAQAGRIWNNTAASEGDSNYEYQQWCLEDSPTAPGMYALVCKAQPDGSLNPTPTAQNNGGRWTYDNNKKNYAFVLGDAASGYGKCSDGNYYYSIRSNNVSGWYLNSSMSGQGFAVNLWSNVADGNGGLWEFLPFDEGVVSNYPDFDQAVYDALPKLTKGDTITICCSVPGYEGQYLSVNKSAGALCWLDDAAPNKLRWACLAATEMDSAYCQKVKLRNSYSNQCIYSVGSSVARLGCQVLTKAAFVSNVPEVTVEYQPTTGDYQLLLDGKNFYPVSLTCANSSYAGCIFSGSPVDRTGLALRAQGAGWVWQKATNTTGIEDIDAENEALTRSVVYDLSGRRVASPSKHGVYIINNKKVLK